MIGVDISGRSIKTAEVAHGRGSLTLKSASWASLAPEAIRRGVIQDVPLVAAALKKALIDFSTATSDVVASIPEVQSFVRVLELPVMGEAEMNEAVQWAIRRHIPFDLDHVYVDWELLTEGNKEGQSHVLVGAAQRDVIDPLLEVFDMLGLSVLALELEAQAVVRCLLPRSPAEARDIRGVLLIDLGATSTNVVFFDRGAMRYTASIQSGGDDLTQRLAERLKLPLPEAVERKARVGLQGKSDDAAVVGVLRETLLELAMRVERIVREMSVQLAADQQVRAVLLSGGAANLPGIAELFSDVFPGVSVQLGNPWTNLSRAKRGRTARLSTEDALHFTTAFGLAERGLEVVL
jgi:type IV pilus assembly protein PilM